MMFFGELNPLTPEGFNSVRPGKRVFANKNEFFTKFKAPYLLLSAADTEAMEFVLKFGEEKVSNCA